MANPVDRRRFGKLTAATLAAAAAPSFARAADEEILIGYHGALSGAATWVGLSGRDGALLAIDEINAIGGVHGRTIRMLSYDDGARSSEAEAVAKKMIQSDNVFAILGGGVSAAAIAVAHEAQRAKIPYVNGVAATPKILDARSRWVFSAAPIDARDVAEIESIFVADYLKVRKIAVLQGTDEYSQAISSSVITLLKERFGVETLTQQKYNPGDTDFTSQWLAVRRANPEHILMFGLYLEGARALKQAGELGVRTPITGDGSFTTAGFLDIAGPAAEGMTAPYTLAHYGNQSVEMIEFAARFRRKYPQYPAERPNHYDATFYGVMYVLAEGMRRAGAGMARKSLVEALETLREWRASDGWPGALNLLRPITFTDGHMGNRRMSYFKVVNGAFQRLSDFEDPQPTSKLPANDTLAW